MEMGIFSGWLAVKSALWTASQSMSLTQPEMEQILDGRHISEFAQFFRGQTFCNVWFEGLLVIFRDGSGAIYYDSGVGVYRHRISSWDAGSATNDFGDPTPLLVGQSGIPFEKVKRYIPPNTPNPKQKELLLVIENFSNDYEDDGWGNRWVGGASHKQSVVFFGVIDGPTETILRQRCSGRQSW